MRALVPGRARWVRDQGDRSFKSYLRGHLNSTKPFNWRTTLCPLNRNCVHLGPISLRARKRPGVRPSERTRYRTDASYIRSRAPPRLSSQRSRSRLRPTQQLWTRPGVNQLRSCSGYISTPMPEPINCQSAPRSSRRTRS